MLYIVLVQVSIIGEILNSRKKTSKFLHYEQCSKYIYIPGTTTLKKDVLNQIVNRITGPGEPCLPPLPPLFCVAKRKKWKQKKKEKGFKAEIINRLSPRLKCYCFGHSRASRIQMVADNTFQCSMTPPLCHSNSLILINLKGHFITFINSIQATHIGFLIHTLGTLFKHVTDKYKTFAIILILGS